MANKKREPGELITTNGLGLPEKLWPIIDAMAMERKESRNAFLRRIIEPAIAELQQKVGQDDKRLTV